jgi:hypothetical protein
VSSSWSHSAPPADPEQEIRTSRSSILLLKFSNSKKNPTAADVKELPVRNRAEKTVGGHGSQVSACYRPASGCQYGVSLPPVFVFGEAFGFTGNWRESLTERPERRAGLGEHWGTFAPIGLVISTCGERHSRSPRRRPKNRGARSPAWPTDLSTRRCCGCIWGTNFFSPSAFVRIFCSG